jgi:hypothetical protein
MYWEKGNWEKKERREKKLILQKYINKIKRIKSPFYQLGWLEGVSYIVSFWFFFFPNPYIILFSIVLLMPILGLLLNSFIGKKHLKLTGRPSLYSLVHLDGRVDGRDKYDVVDYIDIPSVVLFVRVLLDYFQFYSIQSLIIPWIMTFLLILILLWGTHRIFFYLPTNKKWVYISVIGHLLLYSFAGVYGANCVYDRSEPKVYQANVIEKDMHSLKHGASYYVMVSPLGNNPDKNLIRVKRAQFDEIEVGQIVNIDLRKGLFHIPWIYIEREKHKY